MNKNILIHFLLVAGSFASCTSDPLAESSDLGFTIVEGDSIKIRKEKLSSFRFNNWESAPLSMIVGDTVLSYQGVPQLVKPAKLPDLSKVKTKELQGQPFRMVAVGEGFLSGYRDGGYFNEGMLTSLPNLLANQMGVEMKLPLFDKDDFNGFNRRVRTKYNPTGGPVPKYRLASNNTGIEQFNEITRFATLKKAGAERIDNFAFANLRGGIFNPNELVARLELNERTKSDGKGVENIVLHSKADFYVIHDVFEGGFNSILNFVSGTGGNGGTPEIKGINGITSKDIRLNGPTPGVNPRILSYIRIREGGNLKFGVILNTPDYTDFPYLHWIKREDVVAVLQKYKTQIGMPGEDIGLILPSSEIDSLLGPNVNPNLKKGMLLGKPLNTKNYVERNALNYFKDKIVLLNQETAALAKDFNLAVVDVYSIYKKIHQGTYVSPDGSPVKVEEFYSSDGVYPSAFGQAIMTNETIMAINRHYGLDIPLLDSKLFLKR
jgi:hypothetical protein